VNERSTRTSGGTFAHVALGAVALAAATAVQLGRQSGVPAWRSIWAEDGAIFLENAWREPLTDTLFRPYAGYMHVTSRLGAELVALFPVAEAAWLTALLASFLVATIAFFVYHASAFAYAHPGPRVALAAAVVLLPAGAYETTANLSNVHWYLLFACFWALLADGRTRGVLTGRTVFALAAPLANPMAALLAPLLLLRRRDLRARHELLPRVAFLLGLAVQAVVVMRASEDAGSRLLRPLDLAPMFAVRVAGSFLVGDRFLASLSGLLGRTFPLLAIVLVAVIVGGAMRGSDRHRGSVALVAAYAGLAYFLVPLLVRGTHPIWPSLRVAHLGGSRYFVLPILCLLVIFLLGIDRRLTAPSAAFRAVWLPAAGLWLVCVALLNYSFDNPRSVGPDWESSLEQARQSCSSTGETVGVPIPPGGLWQAVTPCRG
jgi:hypothetical protein